MLDVGDQDARAFGDESRTIPSPNPPAPPVTIAILPSSCAIESVRPWNRIGGG